MQAMLDPGDEVLSTRSLLRRLSRRTCSSPAAIFKPVPTRAEDGFRLHVEDLDAALTAQTKAC